MQLGTAEWEIRDAARFALALGDGTFPRSITRMLLQLLREPKMHADDPFAHGLDAMSPPDWRAGQALGDLDPAYRVGWGGSSGETPTFVAEQVSHIHTASGAHYGIAVSYEAPSIPSRDDPGLTRAPAALDEALRELRGLLVGH